MLAKKIIFLSLMLSLGVPQFVTANPETAEEALCSYGAKLFKRGNLEEAARQFKKALLVNPRNETAKEYLRKIFAIEESLESELHRKVRLEELDHINSQLSQIQEDKMKQEEQLNTIKELAFDKEDEVKKLDTQLKGQQELIREKEKELRLLLQDNRANIEQLKGQIAALEEEKRVSREQLAFLREALKKKEEELSRMQEQLFLQKELLSKKEGELNVSLQDERCKIAQLENQLVKFAEEKQFYEEKINSLQSTSSGSIEDLKKRLDKAESFKERCQQELAQKEKALSELALEYERKIEKLTVEKKMLLEESIRGEKEQLYEIEHLMEMLAE